MINKNKLLIIKPIKQRGPTKSNPERHFILPQHIIHLHITLLTTESEYLTMALSSSATTMMAQASGSLTPLENMSAAIGSTMVSVLPSVPLNENSLLYAKWSCGWRLVAKDAGDKRVAFFFRKMTNINLKLNQANGLRINLVI